METTELIRAWKDEEYREKLTADQKAQLPEHPSGLIQFEQPELEDEAPLKAGRHKYTFFHCSTRKQNGC
jgi:mersacidin/lichenicidin family type 2 lantibiotic